MNTCTRLVIISMLLACCLIPEVNKVNKNKKILYIFLLMILPVLIAAFLCYKNMNEYFVCVVLIAQLCLAMIVKFFTDIF